MTGISRKDWYVKKYGMEAFIPSKLLEKMMVKEVPPHTPLLYRGASIDSFQFLVEGEIRCAHYHQNGALAVVSVNTPLMVLGDLEYLRSSSCFTGVITTKTSTLLILPIGAVEEYGLTDPRFLRFLLENMAEKLVTSTSLRLGHLLSVRGRLVLFLAEHSGFEEGESIILPAKENLASMLGASLRQLNRVLSELKGEGLIGGGYPEVRILQRGRLLEILDE